MTLALVITDRINDELVRALLNIMPDLNIEVWPDIQQPQKVQFAVLWNQPAGLLAQFTSLRAITSLGAGVDFIIKDPDLGASVKVSRIVTKNLQIQMAQYVLTYILADYRLVNTYKIQQENNKWLIHNLQDKPVIGFLGFGKIAKFVAGHRQQLGFNIIAYTYGSCDADFSCMQGQSGLQQVMRDSDYLVCLLPLTNQTKNILNHKNFNYCKKQPMLIQVGRGEHLVETDLIKSLDEKIIRHAVIDVFATEPLPESHKFWHRKDITITPHNAARSDIIQTADEIIRRYKQCIDNRPLELQVETDY